ncbi:MAG: extracellular solute-binding protein [Clostridiales bacterium]|nr:extracellular solute-binding protein [Clostridiales bacterium]
MKRTRFASGLLLFVLLLGCLTFPAKAERAMKLKSIVAVDDETIWIHTSLGLVPFSKDGKIAGEARCPWMDCYAVTPDGRIYYAQNGTIAETNGNGYEIQKWNTPLAEITKILVSKNYILIMANETVATLNRHTGAFLSIPMAGLKDIGYYNNDCFIVYLDNFGGIIGTLKCATLEEINYRNTGAVYHGICLSSATSGAYFYNQNNIFSMEKWAKDSSIKKYATFKKDGDIESVVMDNENIYALTRSSLTVHSLEYARIENQKTLSFAMSSTEGQDPRMQKAIEIFAQRHPEYTIKFTGVPRFDTAEAEILSNKSSYDIFYLSSYFESEFKSGDMLMDLSGNETIAENLTHYMEMPFLFENDGSLFGVPVMVQPYTLRASKEKLDKLGIEIPDSWTWDDFFALAEYAKSSNQYLISATDGWDPILCQYESIYCDFYEGVHDYNTEVFQNLVRKWKNLECEGLIYRVNDPSASGGIFRFEEVYYGKDTVSILPMPQLDGRSATPISMYGLYVNRYSKNAEMAVEFLEIYSSPEVQAESQSPYWPMLDVDVNDCAEFYGWYNPELGLSSLTPEDDAIWRELLRTGVVYERNRDFIHTLSELNRQLFEDEISLEEYFAKVTEQTS